jgi:steroid delta-isomerase-like uncharacterized protein
VPVEQNKALLVRLLEEVVVGGDFELMDQLLAPDFVDHGRSQAGGFETFRKEIQALHTAFPDMTLKILHLLAEGDTVVAHLESEGTHHGSFQGIRATGRRISLPSITIVRITNGKVAERWNVFDRYAHLQQLGVIPAG